MIGLVDATPRQGAYTGLAIRPDRTLAAWGFNAFGQVGGGTTVRALVPVTVADPTIRRASSRMS